MSCGFLPCTGSKKKMDTFSWRRRHVSGIDRLLTRSTRSFPGRADGLPDGVAPDSKHGHPGRKHGQWFSECGQFSASSRLRDHGHPAKHPWQSRDRPVRLVGSSPRSRCSSTRRDHRGDQISQTTPKARSIFLKLGRRNALNIARLSLCAILTLDSNRRIATAAVAVGSASPHPVRISTAEKLLSGSPMSPQLLEEGMEEITRSVAQSLGKRASAPYKSLAIRGLAREALEYCFNLEEQRRQAS